MALRSNNEKIRRTDVIAVVLTEKKHQRRSDDPEAVIEAPPAERPQTHLDNVKCSISSLVKASS